jgi:hypothetical protein
MGFAFFVLAFNTEVSLTQSHGEHRGTRSLWYHVSRHKYQDYPPPASASGQCRLVKGKTYPRSVIPCLSRDLMTARRAFFRIYWIPILDAGTSPA